MSALTGLMELKIKITSHPNTMKKTPADFATSPTYLQAIVAVASLTGFASNIATPVHATEGGQATYNPATQKSLGVNGLDLATVTTVATSSYGNSGYGQDDAKSTSDVF